MNDQQLSSSDAGVVTHLKANCRRSMLFGNLIALLFFMTGQSPAQITGSLSPVRHLNDQFVGINGAPNTGAYNLGDTWVFTWADNGNFYTTLNDGGVSPVFPAGGRNLTIASLDSNLETLTNVNTLDAFGIQGQPNTNGWSDDATWKSTCLASIQRVLYMCVVRQLDTPPFSGQYESLQKSYDHGLTWCNYTHSTATGCSASSTTGDPPGKGQFMWNSTTVARGLHPIQYCQDNSIACVSVDNNAKYTYFTSWPSDFTGYYLLRVPTARLPDLAHVARNMQVYIGGDGSQDGAWSATLNNAVKIISGAHMIGSQAYYIAALDQYIMLVGERQELSIRGVGYDQNTLYTAPHPWGPWVRSSVFPADEGITSCTGIVPGTEHMVSPGVVTVSAVCNGEYSVSGAGGVSPLSNGYSLQLATLTLSSSGTTKRTPPSGVIAQGLLQELRFSAPSGQSQTAVPDSSGNGLNAIGSSAGVYTPQGLASFNGQDYYVNTNLSYGGNDFTLFAAFRQFGAHSTYEDIFVNGLDVGGGIVGLYRDNSRNDTYYLNVNGVSSSPITLSDGSWQLVAIRRSNSTVNIYDAASLSASQTPIPLASLSGVTGVLSSGSPFWLGNAVGGTSPAGRNWMDGQYAYWSFYRRALSDSELIQNGSVLSRLLETRGIALARPIGASEKELDFMPGQLMYGVRRTVSSYTGPAMTVRRSSDNARLTVGYTSAGDLDAITLLGFCAATDCFVTRLNFQGSNPLFDLIQEAAANQPRIVAHGALETSGPKHRPALHFAGSQWLATTSFFYYGVSVATNSVVAINPSAPAYCKVVALVNPADGVDSSFAVEEALVRNNNVNSGASISQDRNGAMPGAASQSIPLGSPSSVTTVADSYLQRSYIDGMPPYSTPLKNYANANSFTPRFFITQVMLGYDGVSNALIGFDSELTVWTGSVPSSEAIATIRANQSAYYGTP